MDDKKQSRKWLLTINNPLEAGYDHSKIIDILLLFCPTYFCMADEIATTGTFHTHVFIVSSSPIRFGTIKGRFPTAHIDKAFGNAQENRDYIRKEGKWAETAKAETTIADSFYEWGEIPIDAVDKASIMQVVLEAIREGKTTTEIISTCPHYAFKAKDIDYLRNTVVNDDYCSQTRKVDVTYIYGRSESEITKYLYDRHDAEDIFRVAYYRAKGVSFDDYAFQDVLIFSYFDSQIRIDEMLGYLDEFPLYLPARYANRMARYTKVYITSTIPFDHQYDYERTARPDLLRELEDKVKNIQRYLPDGTIIDEKNGGVYL